MWPLLWVLRCQLKFGSTLLVPRHVLPLLSPYFRFHECSQGTNVVNASPARLSNTVIISTTYFVRNLNTISLHGVIKVTSRNNTHTNNTLDSQTQQQTPAVRTHRQLHDATHVHVLCSDYSSTRCVRSMVCTCVNKQIKEC